MTNSELKSQVLAIMYGDCYVDVNENSGKARLDIYHSKENVDLIEKKREILESINGVQCRVTDKVDSRPLKNGGVREGVRLQTTFSRYFYKLNYLPFKFSSKQLVKPQALAILWQDDGTVCIHHRRSPHHREGRYSFSTATLATDDWPLWKLQAFKKAWNNQYGWCPVIMDYRCRDVNYHRLRLIKLEWLALSDIIRKYTVTSMQYKLYQDL